MKNIDQQIFDKVNSKLKINTIMRSTFSPRIEEEETPRITIAKSESHISEYSHSSPTVSHYSVAKFEPSMNKPPSLNLKIAMADEYLQEPYDIK
jgi:hypothetical protein